MDLSSTRLDSLRIMADRLRRHSLLSTTAAGSGHPSTCFSCAEVVASVFFQFLRFDLEDPKSPANDRFVLSKGHAAPVLWAALAEAGAFPVDALQTLRRIDSLLEGHPTPRSPFVDVATGSLGQGLANAVGMALAARLDKVENRIFVLLGDGEVAEGAVWEAAALASHFGLGAITAVVDVNRLGQSEPTMYQHRLEIYQGRFAAFGWNTQVVDGHDVEAVCTALAAAGADRSKPHAIIARTVKGKGVSFMEDADGWHGKPVTEPAQVEQALQELGPDRTLPEPLSLRKPGHAKQPVLASGQVSDPNYAPGSSVATRQAYGSGLARLGRVNPRIVALDGDCKNSTFSLTFFKEHPERSFECFIAEQAMVGAAAGLASMGKVAFASSFACFLSRACDFIRMAGISQLNLKLCGSHAGVSIGEDGPSQMALEDLGMMRAIPGSTVFYPSDGVSTEKLVALAAEIPGIVYLRTSRPKTPVIYPNHEEFTRGGSKTVRSGASDRVTLVAAGVTLHESMKAAELLQAEGIPARVIDLYSVKPLDVETLRKAARETGWIVTVEDHYPEGGIGEAVAAALGPDACRLDRIAVTGLPRSGTPEELLEMFGLSAEAIATRIRTGL